MSAVNAAMCNGDFIYVPYGVLELCVDLREGADRKVFTYAYDPPVVRFLRRNLGLGHAFVDVGANIGVFAAEAANVVGRSGIVIAVEPNPRLVSRLTAAVERSHERNVQVLGVAVGDSEGELPFYISSSHPYSSLLTDYLPHYPLETTIPIKVRTLDTLVRDIPEITLESGQPWGLKIDAQGMEGRILRAAQGLLRETPPRFIIIEAEAASFQETREYLRAFGFTACEILVSGEHVPLTRTAATGQDVAFTRSYLETGEPI